MGPSFLEELQAQLGDAYRLERELGGGGMSRVVLATETALDRKVVLKVLPPDLAQVLSTERFQREIRLAAALQHPHIVQLLAAGDTRSRSAGGFLYYVMPFVEGQSLRARLEREGPLAAAVAIGILRDVAEALAYAHERGIVHRDIKPDNILLTAGHAVVTDFGVAKALRASAESGDGLTSEGLALGTTAYMAPEQAAADPTTDHRADLYAFGITAYELLTGRTPFGDRAPVAQLAAHAIEAPRPLEEHGQEIPAPVADLVMRCLAKNPAERPDTTEVIATLAAAAPHAPGAAPAARRLRFARPAALALVVAIVSGGAFLWARRAPIPAQASAIALMPFAPPSGDTALVRLGRELTVLLGANLDGQGNIRIADPQAVLAQIGDRPAKLDAALALGRRMGARAVLFGSVVGLGPRVRIEAALHPVAGTAPLARVAAEGHRDSLSALTDSLAWGLLRQLWRGRDAPTPTVAALTTRSWPALRAFLAGEAFLSRALFDSAAEAFGKAVETDSTFWLAWARLNGVRGGYLGLGSDTAMVRRVVDHRADLPQRERTLIDLSLAARNPDSARASSLRERLLRTMERYPDYWYGWYVLAEHDIHSGYRYGTSADEMAAEFKRVIDLNPRFGPAVIHTMDMTFLRDSVLFNQARAQVEPSIWDSVFTMEQLGRMWRDPTRAETLTTRMVNRIRPQFWPHLLPPVLQSFPQTVAQVARESDAPERKEAFALAFAYSHATRGRWDSALASTRALPVALRGVVAYRFAAVAAWLGGLPVEEATRWRRSVPDTLTSVQRAEVAWLDALVAVAARDAIGFRDARRALLASGDSAAPLLDRALGAVWSLSVEGALHPSGETLERLEWDRAWMSNRTAGWLIPVTAPVHRLLAARAVAAMGDTSRAIRLLNFVDGQPMRGSSGPLEGEPAWGTALLRPYALLERARLHEGSGNLRLARLDYEAFLRHFDRPVPALRKLREEGERGYTRVTGARELRAD